MQYLEPGAIVAGATFPSSHAAVDAALLSAAPAGSSGGSVRGGVATSFADYKIIRRNGAVVGFEPSKIAVALTKAFIAVRGSQAAGSAAVREQVERLSANVVAALVRRQPAGGTFHIEDVQDQVELSLMRDGAHDVARAYVLYREQRAQERAARAKSDAPALSPLTMLEGGQRVALDLPRVRALIESACHGLGEQVSSEAILSETVKNLYDGVPLEAVYQSAILAARALIERDPAYAYVTARLLLHVVRTEVLGEEVMQEKMGPRYAEYFPRLIKYGIEVELLDERLAQFRCHAAAGAGPAIQLPRPADAVRPLFPASRRPPDRTAADLFHARGNGPRAERNRARGSRHRVL